MRTHVFENEGAGNFWEFHAGGRETPQGDSVTQTSPQIVIQRKKTLLVTSHDNTVLLLTEVLGLTTKYSFLMDFPHKFQCIAEMVLRMRELACRPDVIFCKS